MAFVTAKLNDVNGYVYTYDTEGALTAITFSGVITDSEWGDWFGSFCLSGAELAAMPAEDPELANTPADARYQALMGWLMVQVKAKHAEMTALFEARPTETPRPAEEVAQLPAITPEMLEAI